MAWAYVRDAEADIEEEEKRVETFHQKILMAEEEARKATENEKSRMKEKKKLEEIFHPPSRPPPSLQPHQLHGVVQAL